MSEKADSIIGIETHIVVNISFSGGMCIDGRAGETLPN